MWGSRAPPPGAGRSDNPAPAEHPAGARPRAHRPVVSAPRIHTTPCRTRVRCPRCADAEAEARSSWGVCSRPGARQLADPKASPSASCGLPAGGSSDTMRCPAQPRGTMRWGRISWAAFPYSDQLARSPVCHRLRQALPSLSPSSRGPACRPRATGEGPGDDQSRGHIASTWVSSARRPTRDGSALSGRREGRTGR